MNEFELGTVLLRTIDRMEAGPIGIRTIFDATIKERLKRNILFGLDRLQTVVDVRHPLTILFVNSTYILNDYPDSWATAACFGLFSFIEGRSPRILVACGLTRSSNPCIYRQKYLFNYRSKSRPRFKVPWENHYGRVLEILTTVAHELCHYEQFKYGKRQTERGVQVRTRNILRKAGIIL